GLVITPGAEGGVGRLDRDLPGGRTSRRLRLAVGNGSRLRLRLGRRAVRGRGAGVLGGRFTRGFRLADRRERNVRSILGGGAGNRCGGGCGGGPVRQSR